MVVSIDVSSPVAFRSKSVNLAGARLVQLSGDGSSRVAPSQKGKSVRLLVLKRGQDEDIRDHPEVAPLLKQEWKIRSVQPRVLEDKGSRLLVHLYRPDPVAS